MICKFRGLRLKRSSIAKIGAEGGLMNLQTHGDVQDLHIPMIDFSMSAYFIQRILGGYYTYYLYFSYNLTKTVE